MEKQDSFAITYGIDPIEYAEDEIKSANFSKRTFGRLKNNRIDTVADLLCKTEVDLLSIKGFGQNSYDEVIKFVKTLSRSVNSGNQKLKVIRRQPHWAREQKELLFAGRFDELDSDYLKNDGEYIDSLREAYEVLGTDIIDKIHKNSLSVIEYERIFRDFYIKNG